MKFKLTLTDKDEFCKAIYNIEADNEAQAKIIAKNELKRFQKSGYTKVKVERITNIKSIQIQPTATDEVVVKITIEDKKGYLTKYTNELSEFDCEKDPETIKKIIKLFEL